MRAPDSVRTEGPISEHAAEADILRISRRGVLKIAAVMFATPVACGPPETESATPPTTPIGADGTAAPRAADEILSERARATFSALSVHVLGHSASAPIESGEFDPGERLAALLRSSPELGAPLRLALAVLEWGIRPVLQKWRPFTDLDGEERDVVLADLARSRLDLKLDLFRGLRSAVFLVFYASPVSRETTLYPGPFGGGTFPIESVMGPAPPRPSRNGRASE